jgi:hypothetical protein
LIGINASQAPTAKTRQENTQGEPAMLGVTLSVDEIEAAPPDVRRWLKQEIAYSLGTRWVAEFAIRADLISRCDLKLAGTGPTEQIRAATGGSSREQEAETADVGAPVYDDNIRKLIAVRAYELWESQGRPLGNDLVNWCQAEHEILSCIEDGGRPVAPERDQNAPENSDSQETPVASGSV